MPLARLRSVAASLVLHAGLLGLATPSSNQPAPSAPTPRRPVVETISIQAPDSIAVAVPAITTARPASRRGPTLSPASDRPAANLPLSRERPARAIIAPARPPEPAPVPVPGPPLAPSTQPRRAPVAMSSASLANGESGSGAAAHASEMAGAGVASRGGTPNASGAGVAGTRGDAISSEARATLLSRYVERLRARVEQHREYPYVARRANLEGTICLRISIAASGRVLGVTPTCGTSPEPLLQAALKAVSHAAPFPPLPAALGGRLTLDVPVVFRLDAL